MNDSRLPPPLHGAFVGGNKPPGGGFARYEHLDWRNQGQSQYDGRSLRKSVKRRTIDHHANIIRYVQERMYKHQRHHIHFNWIQPQKNFLYEYLLPVATSNPIDCVTTKLVHTSTNKIRCPINVLKWTPEGRRLITGSTSGEFTLWNGQMFNFETILQAHDAAIRAMLWSHNENFMVSSDQAGFVKYWQPNMNTVKVFQAHKEPIRGLSFSPADTKLATCSDDSTIKIWDFNTAQEERMITGHGWDVKCVDWHPCKALVASGSKDNLIKLWDAKSGRNLCTFHGHKNTILGLQWNRNGNWLLAGSRDQLIKLYDIRMLKEIQSFKGHKKEIDNLAWHPQHENLFVSGGSDGAIFYWTVGDTYPVGACETAHESNVWSLDWHPLGHVLASGSNDHHTRFWTRNRPEDVIDSSSTKSLDNDKAQNAQKEKEEFKQDPSQIPHDYSLQTGQYQNIPGLRQFDFTAYQTGYSMSTQKNQSVPGLSQIESSMTGNSFIMPNNSTHTFSNHEHNDNRNPRKDNIPRRMDPRRR